MNLPNIINKVDKDMFHTEEHYERFVEMFRIAHVLNVAMGEGYIILDQNDFGISKINGIFEIKFNTGKYRYNNPSLGTKENIYAGNKWNACSDKIYITEEEVANFKTRFKLVAPESLMSIEDLKVVL